MAIPSQPIPAPSPPLCLQEGFAFSHCTECRVAFRIRENVPEDRWWRQAQFRALVARDHVILFLFIQLVSRSLGKRSPREKSRDEDSQQKKSTKKSTKKVNRKKPSYAVSKQKDRQKEVLKKKQENGVDKQ